MFDDRGLACEEQIAASAEILVHETGRSLGWCREVAEKILNDAIMRAWKPASEAPRDGTPISLWLPAPYDRSVTKAWNDSVHGWTDPEHADEMDPESWIGSDVPSHYRQLPPQPEVIEGSAAGGEKIASATNLETPEGCHP